MRAHSFGDSSAVKAVHLVVGVVLLGLLSACGVKEKVAPRAAGGGAGEGVQTEAVRELRIWTSNGWSLKLQPDGSGEIVYGDGGGDDFVQFALPDFDWHRTVQQLWQHSAKEGASDWHLVVFFETGSSSDRKGRYTNDTALIQSLFERAHRHITYVQTSVRFDQLWESRPVFPHMQTAEESSETVKAGDVLRINVWTPSGWSLQVGPDGTGSMGVRTGSPEERANFALPDFHWRETVEEFLALTREVDGKKEPYGFDFTTPPNHGTFRYTTNGAAIEDFFEKAHRHIVSVKDPVKFEKLWEERAKVPTTQKGKVGE